MPNASRKRAIFRVDKFVVPQQVRAEFMARVEKTRDLLDTFDGCLQNLILEQISGPGTFNVVTMVEWASEDALEKARETVASHYRDEEFDPQAFLSRLGVVADMANYSEHEAMV